MKFGIWRDKIDVTFLASSPCNGGLKNQPKQKAEFLLLVASEESPDVAKSTKASELQSRSSPTSKPPSIAVNFPQEFIQFSSDFLKAKVQLPNSIIFAMKKNLSSDTSISRSHTHHDYLSIDRQHNPIQQKIETMRS